MSFHFLTVAHPSQGCVGISCCLLKGCLRPHSCGQAGSKRRRKHLQAGKNKGYVSYLKEREETKLSKTSPQAGWVKSVVNSLINLYDFLFQILVKFWKSMGGKKIKQKNTPATEGQFWISHLFSLIHTAYSKGANQAGGKATVRLCTAEVFRDPGEVLKRHCQASAHLTGLEKKFRHTSPSCPSIILKIKYAVKRKTSWEAIQKQEINYPTGLDLESHCYAWE